MDWANLFTVALGAILVNNFIVAQFLGICPFMGVSKKVETASGMGLAVIFVMGLASGADLHADCDLHPGHRRPGAVH